MFDQLMTKIKSMDKKSLIILGIVAGFIVLAVADTLFG